MMVMEHDRVLAELRAELSALYGQRLKDLILFGSQARGDAEAGSDLDVLVVLGGEVNPGEEIARTGRLVADLCLRHEVVISCLFMDEERFRDRQGPLLRNIRREGMRI